MYNYPIQYQPKNSINIQTTENGYIISHDGKIYSCVDDEHLLNLVKEKLSTKKEGDN